jgi:hypothetical protein
LQEEDIQGFNPGRIGTPIFLTAVEKFWREGALKAAARPRHLFDWGPLKYSSGMDGAMPRIF